MLENKDGKILRKLSWVILVTLITGLIIITACAGKGAALMAQNGDKVKVHYTGTLKDGTEFDSSTGREPLAFTVGAGQMIQGFDRAVVGMKVGETKTVTITAAQAYGEKDQNLIITIDKKNLPPTITPKVGDMLKMSTSGGGSVNVKVTKVENSSITVDANHELAGQDLTFKITMVDIKR
jgi:peptidylprolyl isomerase